MSVVVRSGLVLALAAGCAAAVSGCAGKPSPPPSRYVGDLAGLERVSRGVWNERWERPGVDLGAYRAVAIAPARLSDPFEMYGDHYRQYDRELLLGRFDRALRQGFEETGWLVDAPGARVLEVQPPLTGAQANRPPLDTTDQTIVWTARGVGRAAMQLALRDSETGELLVAIVGRKQGPEFSVNFNRNTTWGDAEHAFRFWARMLRQMLERAGLGGEAAGQAGAR